MLSSLQGGSQPHLVHAMAESWVPTMTCSFHKAPHDYSPNSPVLIPYIHDMFNFFDALADKWLQILEKDKTILKNPLLWPIWEKSKTLKLILIDVYIQITRDRSISLNMSVYDKDHMSALQLKNTNESDPRSYAVTLISMQLQIKLRKKIWDSNRKM